MHLPNFGIIDKIAAFEKQFALVRGRPVRGLPNGPGDGDMTMTWPRLGVAAILMTGLAILALFTAVGGAVAILSFNPFCASFDRLASTQ